MKRAWHFAHVALTLLLIGGVFYLRNRFSAERQNWETLHDWQRRSVKEVAVMVAKRDVEARSASVLIARVGLPVGPRATKKQYIDGWPSYIYSDGCMFPFFPGRGDPLEEFVTAYNAYLKQHPSTNSSDSAVDPASALSGTSGSP